MLFYSFVLFQIYSSDNKSCRDHIDDITIETFRQSKEQLRYNYLKTHSFEKSYFITFFVVLLLEFLSSLNSLIRTRLNFIILARFLVNSRSIQKIIQPYCVDRRETKTSKKEMKIYQSIYCSIHLTKKHCLKTFWSEILQK